jgi:hypothetical protein
MMSMDRVATNADVPLEIPAGMEMTSTAIASTGVMIMAMETMAVVNTVSSFQTTAGIMEQEDKEIMEVTGIAGVAANHGKEATTRVLPVGMDIMRMKTGAVDAVVEIKGRKDQAMAIVLQVVARAEAHLVKAAGLSQQAGVQPTVQMLVPGLPLIKKRAASPELRKQLRLKVHPVNT